MPALEEEIEHRLRQYCRAHGLAAEGYVGIAGRPLLLALSGGADSTALALALNRLGLPLRACHVNHGQRAESADADEEFCRELCGRLGIKLHVVKASLPPGSSEEAMRHFRYEALAKAALDAGCAVIVTAHNQDDQAETMLFRLFRGTSPRGLTAIKPWRRLNEESSLTLLRPMLALSRSEILAYLQELGENFRQDESNNDRQFKRNFIRHEVLPRVLEAFPEALANMENFRRILAGEDSYLHALASSALQSARLEKGLDVAVLKKMPRPLLARALVLYLEELNLEPTFARLDRLIDWLWQPGSYSFGQGQRVEISHCLSFAAEPEDLEEQVSRARAWMTDVPIRLPAGEEGSKLNIIPWINRVLRIEAIDLNLELGAESFPGRRELEIIADGRQLAQCASAPLLFRLRQAGDFIVPLGMTEKVRLKQYLHANAGPLSLLPASYSQALALRLTPVLARGEEVLWVPGIGLSERLRLRSRAGLGHRLSLLPLAEGGFASLA